MPPSPDDWLPAIPADFYDQLARSLSLHGMACAELLSRPTDELLALTSLSTLRVAELNTITSHEHLLRALRQEPRTLYDLLLLGRLTLDTSLAAPVLRYVQRQMGIDDAQLQELKVYCQELSGAFLGLLEQHLPAELSLGLHRLRVEEVFSQYLTMQPAAAPLAATVRFSEPQLQMMRLALLLVHSLPEAGDHPFLRAVAALPTLRPAALEPLIARLSLLEPTQELPLTMPELVQLYQAMQVCGLVFVSEVLEKVGSGNVCVPPAEAAILAGAPEPSGRQAVGEMVSGFTRWVQHTFPGEPALQQAQQQILALADTL
jgi:hypothetical protein